MKEKLEIGTCVQDGSRNESYCLLLCIVQVNYQSKIECISILLLLYVIPKFRSNKQTLKDFAEYDVDELNG